MKIKNIFRTSAVCLLSFSAVMPIVAVPSAASPGRVYTISSQLEGGI